jgi:molecular chaperone DnaK
MGRAIGIDLGTTNSCAAVVEDGVPRVLTYPNGAKTIPSVFAIDKTGNRLIGEEAREQAALNPLNTIAASKRLIGRSFASKAVERMQQIFTYELLEGEDSEVLIKVADQVLTLEQISAAILTRVRDNAEAVLGEEVDQAVITVPAYFNDRQRQAVRAAGKLAGLQVLRVLNEPTAAALAYGLGRTLDQRVAIYDLGGGTFDISIIDIKDKVFEVVATGGDTFLGGVDFDDRVMQWVLKEFLIQHDVDLSYDRTAITRLRDASENAKIRLSKDDSYVMHVDNIAKGDDGQMLDLHLEMTREKLEELTGDLVIRSVQTVERIFQEAGTDRHQIDELLLVGGQSKMPMVRSQLEAFLGRPPSQGVHPDEAVAMGAAIMAKSLSAKSGGPRDVTLFDVLPMPIGIAKPDGFMSVLFERNLPLPARRQRRLKTSKEDQKTLVLRLYQGESNKVDDNEMLGSFVFYGLRKGPKGDVRLLVDFHIDSEGILNLSARDEDTGEVVQSKIKLDQESDRPKKKAKAKAKTKSAGKAASPAALDMPLASITPDDDGSPLAELDLEPVEVIPEPVRKPDPRRAEPRRPETPRFEMPVEEVQPERTGIDSLRSQVRRPAADVDDADDKAKGIVGWIKGLFGGGAKAAPKTKPKKR